jgi:hypothetical protein
MRSRLPLVVVALLVLATMTSLAACANPTPNIPAQFAMPDFTGKSEKSVVDWLEAHHAVVTATFDYGEAEGTACAEAGDGVVKAQSESAGMTVANLEQTRLIFDTYCSY